jgi:hypothetical protein
VGKTVLHYNLACLDDVYAMLKAHDDWMELGSVDEQKPAKKGTVEAWDHAEGNPAGGWYGLKKGVSRPLWHVYPSFDGSPWAGRGNPRKAGQ